MKLVLALAFAVALIPGRVHADAPNDAEQAVVMMEQLATIIDTHKDNCDSMGDKLATFMDKNAERLKRLKDAGKKVSAEDKKRFSEKYKDRMKAVYDKMAPGLQKCAQNAKVSAAMKTATAK
ncbi:MAG: hypothetical protein ABI467_09300 [Kofleriaceae bacterium]